MKLWEVIPLNAKQVIANDVQVIYAQMKPEFKFADNENNVHADILRSIKPDLYTAYKQTKGKSVIQFLLGL